MQELSAAIFSCNFIKSAEAVGLQGNSTAACISSILCEVLGAALDVVVRDANAEWIGEFTLLAVQRSGQDKHRSKSDQKVLILLFNYIPISMACHLSFKMLHQKSKQHIKGRLGS